MLLIVAQNKDGFSHATVNQRYSSPFRIIKAIFLKSQQVKLVKVHDLGTKYLDHGNKKRQLETGGSWELGFGKTLFCWGRELGGSSW